MESTPICSDISCTHQSESCTAYIPSSLFRIFTNPTQDKLFFIYDEKMDELSKTIGYIDLNGQNKRIIYKSGQWEDISRHFVFSNDSQFLFFFTFEFIDDSYVYKLHKLNVETSKKEVLYESKQESYIAGAFDNQIILLELDQSLLGLISKEKIYSLDVNSLSLKKLEEYTISNSQKEVCFVDSSYMYKFEKNSATTAKVYKTDLSSGITTVLTSSAPFEYEIENTQFYGVWNNYLSYLIIEGGQEQRATYRKYSININTGEIIENKLSLTNIDKGLQAEHITILAQNDDSFVVRAGYDFNTIKMLDNETGRTYYMKYGFSRLGIINQGDYINNNTDYKIFNGSYVPLYN
ncbi:MAG: hypothetical protein IJN77_00740 [Oscillospiraceae bacterium]|nr:hypothetical protein [Oscillospiraceae bacterium]